jgi:N-acetylglucosaminyl-diphospho-decaprenol L-rhamnosyltransferase
MILSIIIVNYQVKAFLEQCLYSVYSAVAKAGWQWGAEVEVLVVDNHSTDGSKDYLESLFPEVRFIWLEENLGFGKANNIGWKQASGEAVLFLNPDTILQEDTLAISTHWMQTHPRCGALGIRMIDGSGQYLPESKRGFPNLAASFFKLTGIINRFPKHPVIAAYYAGHLSPDQNHVVDVLAGAYMLVRMDVLRRTQGFDEQFFMYAEDIDLSYRIQLAGYENHYLADTRMLHFKGESSLKDKNRHARYFYDSMALFYHKHFKNTAGYFWQRLIIRSAISANQVQKIWLSKQETLPATASSPFDWIIGDEQACRSIQKKFPTYTATAGCLTKPTAGHSLVDAIPPSQLAKGNAHSTMLSNTHVPQGSALMVIDDRCTYEAVLNMYEAHGKEVRLSLHRAGSKSMVGSKQKDQTGQCIFAEAEDSV